MENVILVDGYNVIYKWKTLEKFIKNIEFARNKFIEVLANYQGYTQYIIKIVFDSSLKNPVTEQIYPKNIEVIFTPIDLTADNYIERLVYKDENPGRIKVVTADIMERMSVGEKGAVAVFPETFEKEVIAVCNRGVEQ